MCHVFAVATCLGWPDQSSHRAENASAERGGYNETALQRAAATQPTEADVFTSLGKWGTVPRSARVSRGGDGAVAIVTLSANIAARRCNVRAGAHALRIDCGLGQFARHDRIWVRYFNGVTYNWN
jgi:hypothetical protein